MCHHYTRNERTSFEEPRAEDETDPFDEEAADEVELITDGGDEDDDEA
jgi:hypothetical protein